MSLTSLTSHEDSGARFQTTPDATLQPRASFLIVSPPTGLSGSNFADSEYPFEMLAHGPEVEPQEKGPFLDEAEARFLREIDADVIAISDHVNGESLKLLRGFSEGVGLSLARHSDTRCAVFAEEDHSVTLLAHCRQTRRQVSFEFKPDGMTVEIIQIDEALTRSLSQCKLRHTFTLGNAIAWLKRRS